MKVLVFLVFLCLSLVAKEPLKKVLFVGNKALTTKYLEENLNIVVEKSWYEFYKDASPKIDKKVILPLTKSLINLYKTQGFYKVRVDTTQSDNNITFNIDIK